MTIDDPIERCRRFFPDLLLLPVVRPARLYTNASGFRDNTTLRAYTTLFNLLNLPTPILFARLLFQSQPVAPRGGCYSTAT